jgi:hypothetical protein
MYTLLLILSLVAAAFAAPPSLLQTRQTTSCSTPNGLGFCGSTASGCSGSFYAGYCPGASDIQCCVTSCTTPSGSGNCLYTTESCSGTFSSGYCPGSSDYQVCFEFWEFLVSDVSLVLRIWRLRGWRKRRSCGRRHFRHSTLFILELRCLDFPSNRTAGIPTSMRICE